MKQKEQLLPALFTFFAALGVYIYTLAPTVSLWDCGEFIASSVTLGVPHPPGAPFYLLIGRFFSMIPFATDIAFRVNIIAALSSALTVLLLYLIIVLLAKEFYGEPKTFEKKMILYGSGMIGALTFAFTETFWFNATEAEVYSFSMLLTALPIYLALRWMDTHQDRSSIKLLILCSYLFGLAVGVHLLNILLIPSILVLIFFYQPGLFKDYKLWSVAAVIFLLGCTTYFMIYIRANMGPFLNENDPSTWDGFMAYWNREQYGKESLFVTLFDRKAPFWAYQVKKMYLRYFAWNFIGKGTTLGADRYIVETFSGRGLFYMPFLFGLVGVINHFRRDWKRAIAIMLMFIMTGIAIIVYLNQPDPQPRERDYVYVGSFFAFAIWIGIGMLVLAEKARDLFKDSESTRTLAVGVVVGLGFIIGPYLQLNKNFNEQDRTGNYFAYDYSYNILNSCEENAVLFTNGDNDTFPLWYLQTVVGVRTDITIVNLSLLNTDWYIKQLKYGNPLYPPLPIALDDEKIKSIRPIAFKKQDITLPVPRNVYNSILSELHSSFLVQPVEKDTSITFTVSPTISDQGIRVQDIMILNIIYGIKWERPVYFAMTVSPSNKVGLAPFLRMDGMAFKLVPQSSNMLAADILAENLLEKFRYRGFNDPDVYYNRQKLDLFQNIRSCYLWAIDFFRRQNDREMFKKLLYAHEEHLPGVSAPYPNIQSEVQFAQLFKEVGDTDKAINMLRKSFERTDIDDNVRLDLAQLLSGSYNDHETAENACKAILAVEPFHMRAYSLLITIYENQQKYDESISLVEDWLEKNPEDANAKTLLEQLIQKAEKDSTQ